MAAIQKKMSEFMKQDKKLEKELEMKRKLMNKANLSTFKISDTDFPAQ